MTHISVVCPEVTCWPNISKTIMRSDWDHVFRRRPFFVFLKIAVHKLHRTWKCDIIIQREIELLGLIYYTVNTNVKIISMYVYCLSNCFSPSLIRSKLLEFARKKLWRRHRSLQKWWILTGFTSRYGRLPKHLAVT